MAALVHPNFGHLGRVLPGEREAFSGVGTPASCQRHRLCAKDNYKRDGATYSFVAAFSEVEVDVETGVYHILDYHMVADVGTVIHPRALGGQILGRSILGIGHAIGHKWVYDQRYGVALAKRFYQNKPPTILDLPVNMGWSAVELAASRNAGWRQRDRRAACCGGDVRGVERHLRCAGRRSVPSRAGQS